MWCGSLGAMENDGLLLNVVEFFKNHYIIQQCSYVMTSRSSKNKTML